MYALSYLSYLCVIRMSTWAPSQARRDSETTAWPVKQIFCVLQVLSTAGPKKAGKGKALESLNQSCRQSRHVSVENAGQLERQVISTMISCSASFEKHAGSAA